MVVGQARRSIVRKAGAGLRDLAAASSLRHSRAEQGAKRRAQTLESMPLRQGAANRAEFWALALYGNGHGMDSRVCAPLRVAPPWNDEGKDSRRDTP
ncbi:hypothetical protein MPLSOD_320037 [Mesorhizobium sp. SOD10]|nr:hypothetical protein MPLSOD_320037 [Mesorhizobium sp. SOD10]